MMIAVAVTLVLSFLLVGAVLWVARRGGWLDVPGARSSHPAPVPTGGGLGLVGAIMLGSLIGAGRAVGDPTSAGEALYPAFWSGATALALGLSAVGFLDDLRGVSALLRFLLQLLAAGALLATLGLDFSVGFGLGFMVVVVVLTWTMNAYNFMDGSHGMAGLQGLFSGALLAVVFAWQDAPALALAAATVAAACGGFLPWNFPRPRGFMGDAGSVPLGFLLGGLCFAGVLAGVFPWPTALLVLALFYVDAGLTLARRLWRGERWYTAHREHVYQRLIKKGWTHTRVALAYQAVNVMVVAPAVVLGTANTALAGWVSAAAAAALVIGWVSASSGLGERS